MFGVYDLANNLERYRITKPVAEILVHEDWDPHTERYNDDIAILVMEESISFSTFVRPICLTASIGDVTKGTVAGWGKTAMRQAHYENIPTKIDITIMQSNEDCYHQQSDLAKLGSKKSFCAGYPDVKVCSGDSGSGLFVIIDDTYYLKGIVSASQSNSDKCSLTNLTIYTDVLKYIDFIGVNIQSK